MKLIPVAHALLGRAIDGQFAQVLNEASWFSHGEKKVERVGGRCSFPEGPAPAW
jgi:hypothetical protein